MNDYKHMDSGDIDFSIEDLQITESTDQHQRDLLLSDKGHVRDKPEAGVGAVNHMLDENPDEFLRSVRKEFASDGMKVKKIDFLPYTNELDVDARYEN